MYASSTKNQPLGRDNYPALLLDGNGWAIGGASQDGDTRRNQFVEIDLNSLHYVTAITVDRDRDPSEPVVTGFRVLLSIDRYEWNYVKENSKVKVILPFIFEYFKA